MAHSSAKPVDGAVPERREQHGAHRVLINPRYKTLAGAGDATHLLNPNAWTHSQPVSTGRGANWFVDNGGDHFVLRHFRRGGAVAWLLGDKYWFRSEDATRSFAEFRLLQTLYVQRLPVPEPVAAGFVKRGPWYTAQLLTRRIPDAQSWSARLQSGAGEKQPWDRVGEVIARIHSARVDHADLNAHNLLLDRDSNVFVIDFDKGIQRDSTAGGWRQANLARLQRSLYKILATRRDVVEAGWPLLIEAYENTLSAAP